MDGERVLVQIPSECNRWGDKRLSINARKELVRKLVQDGIPEVAKVPNRFNEKGKTYFFINSAKTNAYMFTLFSYDDKFEIFYTLYTTSGDVIYIYTDLYNKCGLFNLNHDSWTINLGEQITIPDLTDWILHKGE